MLLWPEGLKTTVVTISLEAEQEQDPPGSRGHGQEGDLAAVPFFQLHVDWLHLLPGESRMCQV